MFWRKRKALPKILQVEVTSACQLECSFCPRTVLKDVWVSTHLRWDSFAALLPFVKHTELVHLQGWGEPLLNPRFWDMAAAVKEQGGRVSMTTNAMLLDEAASREICKIGFDLVAVSMAGATPETHNAFRKRSSFDQICANISSLCRLNGRPSVHLVMQMMKKSVEEAPQLVALASTLGADKVVLPNLDYAPTPDIDAIRAFLQTPDPRTAEIIEEARRRGNELGVTVHAYPLVPQEGVLVCDANPTNNVWITVWGEVSPCPYVSLPCRGNVPRLIWGEDRSLPRFSFGNIADGLPNVYASQRARAFREAFAVRLKIGELAENANAPGGLSLPGPKGESFALLEMIGNMSSSLSEADLPPAPEPCRHCYKLYGL